MDEEGEHFSAGDAAEDGMVDSPTPPPSPPPASSSSSSSLERATSALPRRGLVIKSAKPSKRAHKSQWLNEGSVSGSHPPNSRQVKQNPSSPDKQGSCDI